MTDADSTQNAKDSTVERKVHPDLSHVQQSCYPPIAPKKASACASAESMLLVISQPEEKDSESDHPPPSAESSCEEDLSRGAVGSDTSDSESDVPNSREGYSSQFLVPKKARLIKPKSLPAAISKDLSEKEKHIKNI